MAFRKIEPESSSDLYGDSPMVKGSEKKKIYYPSTSFDNKTLPEGKDWKVGKTYRVTLDLKMKGISNRVGSDGVERGNYDFDIVGIDPTGEVKPGPAKYPRIKKKK